MSGVAVVTGATGHVGGAAVRELRKRGVAVRAIGRSAERLKELAALGAEVHAGSLEDIGFLQKAFEGASVVFAMIPPNTAAPDVRAYQRGVSNALATAMARARVSHAVSLSSLGADQKEGTGPIAGLHDFEKRLEAAPGLNVRHLRPTYFMENAFFSIGLIKGQGINGSPLKGGYGIPMIATRDIGGALAGLLEKPNFSGHSIHELLGPRDYTMREATRILGESIGRPELPYVEFPPEDARKAMIGMGLSPDMARLFVEMYDGFNTKRIKPVQGRTPETTTPTTLEQFAKDTFAPAFKA
jgi:uncharacterized protein YbjT (DUF2867 family)